MDTNPPGPAADANLAGQQRTSVSSNEPREVDLAQLQILKSLAMQQQHHQETKHAERIELNLANLEINGMKAKIVNLEAAVKKTEQAMEYAEKKNAEAMAKLQTEHNAAFAEAKRDVKKVSTVVLQLMDGLSEHLLSLGPREAPAPHSMVTALDASLGKVLNLLSEREEGVEQPTFPSRTVAQHSESSASEDMGNAWTPLRRVHHKGDPWTPRQAIEDTSDVRTPRQFIEDTSDVGTPLQALEDTSDVGTSFQALEDASDDATSSLAASSEAGPRGPISASTIVLPERGQGDGKRKRPDSSIVAVGVSANPEAIPAGLRWLIVTSGEGLAGDVFMEFTGQNVSTVLNLGTPELRQQLDPQWSELWDIFNEDIRGEDNQMGMVEFYLNHADSGRLCIRSIFNPKNVPDLFVLREDLAEADMYGCGTCKNAPAFCVRKTTNNDLCVLPLHPTRRKEATSYPDVGYYKFSSHSNRSNPHAKVYTKFQKKAKVGHTGAGPSTRRSI